ncbi:MAG: hypothetical protein IPP71_21760 [Bacteroidetes bacterium]|nr:hypothetical protein [Bacteroidota bacterium]
MNSNSRIRIFVIVAFLASGSLLYYAYSRMQENVNSLVTTVKESAQPDRDLIRIKELWTSINAAGNNVRAFAVTRDNNYLVQFLEMKDTLKAGIDSLKSGAITAGRNIDDFIKLDTLLSSKIEIYDHLLEINYNRIITDAIKNLDENELKDDTTDIFKDQGSMLQRMFSGKYSRKALKLKADSLLAERNTKVTEFNKNANRIREEEALKLRCNQKRN